MAPPSLPAPFAEKVEPLTLRVPMPPSSPLSMAPPLKLMAELPENVEPLTVAVPVPP